MVDYLTLNLQESMCELTHACTVAHACVKRHAVPDPRAPELTKSSRDFRSGGPGSINILIDPNDP